MDVPRRPAALALLVVGALLLGAPVYADAPDRQAGLVATPAAMGDALTSSSDRVAATSSLRPVAEVAVERAVRNGSFAVRRDDHPLFAQLLVSHWTYVASDDAYHRPEIRRVEGRPNLVLPTVDAATVRDRYPASATLGPEALAERVGAVVSWRAFGDRRSKQLSVLVVGGRLPLTDGNDATTFAPLGESVQFVYRAGAFYRVRVAENASHAVLSTEPVDTATVVAATDVTVVDPEGFDRTVRDAVADALADPGVTVALPPVSEATARQVGGALVRHDGHYYRLTRDFGPAEATNLGRGALGVSGLLALVAGSWLLASPRRRGS